jgi:DNA topoisomerase I
MNEPTIKATEKLIIDAGYRQAYSLPGDIPVVVPTQSHLSNLKIGSQIKPRKVIVQRQDPILGMSEAALIRILQANGTGRPATYALIVETLLRRKYIQRDDRGNLVPTNRGQEVCTFLTKTYPTIFDPDFTARMEENLDMLAAGKSSYTDILQALWILL